MRRFQFTTSTSHGHVAGRVIEVDTPGPQLREWLRSGILRELPDPDAEVALAPEAIERAVARRLTPRGRKRRTHGAGRSRNTTGEDGKPVVPLLCPGGTVACLAGGPSLTAEDVAFVRGTADAVVAVNDAHRLAPWADVLYSSDQRWYAHYQGVPTFQGLKFGLQPLVAPAPWGVTVLQNTGDRGLELDPGGLRNGRNSGYAAVNLAVHLGAARILLLGYDLGHAPHGLKHWFGDHPDGLRAMSPYQTFLVMFESIVEPLRQIGVEVINCSRQTALTVFPRVPLAEALSVQLEGAASVS